MNEIQSRIIGNLRNDIIKHDAHGSNYEYKAFEITESGPPTNLVFVYAVVGLKGDEGTMAEVLARTSRNISITPRGGVRLLNAAYYRGSRKKYSRAKKPVSGYRSALISLTA